MIVYIAGKITGLHKTIYTTNFNYMEDKLLALGFDTINPVRILNDSLPYDEIMGECFKLVEKADVIYFMPNWIDSEGAKKEYEYAKKLGKIIIKGGRT